VHHQLMREWSLTWESLNRFLKLSSLKIGNQSHQISVQPSWKRPLPAQNQFYWVNTIVNQIQNFKVRVFYWYSEKYGQDLKKQKSTSKLMKASNSCTEVAKTRKVKNIGTKSKIHLAKEGSRKMFQTRNRNGFMSKRSNYNSNKSKL